MDNSIFLPDIPLSDFETTQNYAYLRLRNALMVGAISPGIAITIQDISESLDVSATPVREALRQLCSENALQSLKNRRIMVPVMTPVRFEELISLRCALETYAAKRALPYINNMEIDNLERIDNQLDQAQSEENWSEMVLLNQRFHSGLYVANPNQVVMPMIESIWLQLGPFMGVAAKYQQEFYLVDHHKEAIESLRQNDPVKLESAIAADIRDGVGQLNPENLQNILLEQETK